MAIASAHQFTTLSDDDIDKIRESENLDELIPDEQKEELKQWRTGSTTSYWKFARLTVTCYDLLRMHLHSFEGKTKLTTFLDQFPERLWIDALRDDVTAYGHGQNFGDYFTGERITDAVSRHRNEFLALITVFFQIFEEEN